MSKPDLSITPAHIEHAWTQAMSSEEDCKRLIAILEAVVPTLTGDDRLNAQAAVTNLRTYAELMFALPRDGEREH